MEQPTESNMGLGSPTSRSKRNWILPLTVITSLLMCGLCSLTCYLEVPNYNPLPVHIPTGERSNIYRALKIYAIASNSRDMALLQTVATKPMMDIYNDIIGQTLRVNTIMKSVKVLEYTPHYALVDAEWQKILSADVVQDTGGCYFLLRTDKGWKVEKSMYLSGCDVPDKYARSPFRLFRWILNELD